MLTYNHSVSLCQQEITCFYLFQHLMYYSSYNAQIQAKFGHKYVKASEFLSIWTKFGWQRPLLAMWDDHEAAFFFICSHSPKLAIFQRQLYVIVMQF